MSDHERRGAYTPQSDEPLHFDARRPRASGGGTPPTTLLVSAVILLVLVGGAFAYYRSGIRHDGQAPAVVGTPIRDKGAAPASDQPQDPAAGLQVYNSENPQGAAPAPTLAPAPEEPLPRIAAPAASAPVTRATLPAAPAAAQTATVTPKPMKPAPKVVELASSTPPAKVPASSVAPAKPVKAASATGAALVQIGAFSSNSQADKGWNDAARVSPSKMLGKGKKVETVDKDGHTLYRTFVTGFASRDDATAFCDDLKSAGKSCIVR
jgi:cell division protein FtsN